MTKIYTKTGDQGTTQLADKSLVKKNSLNTTACGSIDELSAFLGLARVFISKNSKITELPQQLVRIQKQLIKLNSQLALASGAENITMHDVEKLEQEIDVTSSNLPPLSEFIIFGGNEGSAYLHVARTVCRRAERAVVELATTTTISDVILPYLNRLSDWLFTKARFMENLDAKK